MLRVFQNLLTRNVKKAHTLCVYRQEYGIKTIEIVTQKWNAYDSEPWSMERSGAVYTRLLRKVVSDKMIDKLEEFAKLLKEKIEKRKNK